MAAAQQAHDERELFHIAIFFEPAEPARLIDLSPSCQNNPIGEGGTSHKEKVNLQ
jgi:hypothetical protein